MRFGYPLMPVSHANPTVGERLTPWLNLFLGLCLLLARTSAAQSQPVRYQAQYTQIYSDDFETVGPALMPGFVMDTAGSFSTAATEVIAGSRSIKGSYSGTGSYTGYLHTDAAAIPLLPNRGYQTTFRYTILTAPNKGFEVLFYSPTGGAAGSYLPSVIITGAAGDTGTATLTNTLGPYSDYQARWDIVGTGAISIDEIQIIDGATGKVIASENAEGSAPNVGPGLLLGNGASIVTDPALVIGGRGSVRLTNYGSVATKSSWPLAANTTYILEFDYRIVNRGTDQNILWFHLQPAGTTDPLLWQASGMDMLKNAPASGVFSAGAMTGQAASYILTIAVSSATASLVIDNIRILRQDATSAGKLPDSWGKLASLPFPRLGNYILASAAGIAQGAPNEGAPFTYSVDQLESRLAFSDVIFGLGINAQVSDTASIRRLRTLNPNAVILPYRISQEQGGWPAPSAANPNLEYAFIKELASEWYTKDTKGNDVPDPDYPDIRKMNISDFCPAVNGRTFTGYLSNWLDTTLFPSGMWDGVFFDNLFGRINPHILNFNDPALLDYDWNRNGVRDETPASSSEMTRNSAIRFLTDVQSRIGGSQLVMGNTGGFPELALAPYVNGYVFEGFNLNYNGTWSPQKSTGQWFATYDSYRWMQTNTRQPRLNVLQASGGILGKDTGYLAPTTRDFQEHRLGLGTALLNDGFYEYDLKDNLSAPYWFDEYSVDQNGVAVEDRSKKGYLGQALAPAVELGGASALLIQEGFEGGAMPPGFTAQPAGGAAVSQAPGDVIAGNGSLTIANPDHTKRADFSVNWNPAGMVPAVPTTYLLVFDWRVLESLDGVFTANGGNDYSVIPGVIAGDSGTVRFPMLISPGRQLSVAFAMSNGGGKVAIDNVRLYQGGGVPLRRDFENGFALVNPFSNPYTFSVNELAGSLHRTGIHRIKGTQAPDVNNGQPVTGSLTLGAFDGLILLANHMDAQAAQPAGPKPYVKPAGVISASNFGAFASIAPGSWIEIYGSNLSATTRGWTGNDFNGPNAPTALDGVTVTLGDRAAFIDYVSPGQVNVLVPSDVPLGPIQVVVSGPAGTAAPYIITVENAQPGLLAPPAFRVDGKAYVAALAADGRTYILASGAIPGLPSRPAKPGETITLYGIGFGKVTPDIAAGVITGQGNSLANRFEVLFGSVPATLQYYGLAPGATGLYQFNVVVPNIADNPSVPLTFRLAGTPGPQSLYIPVQR